MTKDEALKLALVALVKNMSCDDDCKCSGQQAVTAIKEALAQPEQEQVEWGVDWGPDGNSVSIIKRLADGGIEVVGWEYAPHPPQRKPLTDEEIDKAMAENKQKLFDTADNYIKMRRAYARIIEAAHGIKG